MSSRWTIGIGVNTKALDTFDGSVNALKSSIEQTKKSFGETAELIKTLGTATSTATSQVAAGVTTLKTALSSTASFNSAIAKQLASAAAQMAKAQALADDLAELQDNIGKKGGTGNGFTSGGGTPKQTQPRPTARKTRPVVTPPPVQEEAPAPAPAPQPVTPQRRTPRRATRTQAETPAIRPIDLPTQVPAGLHPHQVKAWEAAKKADLNRIDLSNPKAAKLVENMMQNMLENSGRGRASFNMLGQEMSKDIEDHILKAAAKVRGSAPRGSIVSSDTFKNYKAGNLTPEDLALYQQAARMRAELSDLKQQRGRSNSGFGSIFFPNRPQSVTQPIYRRQGRGQNASVVNAGYSQYTNILGFSGGDGPGGVYPGREMGDAFRRVGMWGTAAGISYGAVHGVTGGVKTAGDFEQKMLTIQRVSNPLTTNTKELTQQAKELGQAFGTSLNDIADGMTIFAQQGMQMNEVLSQTKVAALAANVTEMSLTDATEALTAAQKQFGLGATQSMRVLDSWVEVANTTAVNATVLADALKRAGTASKVAGMDWDMFNGIVAAVGEATRKSGDEIGTAMKFIFQHIRDDKAVESLQEVGIGIEDAAGNFKSARQIMSELSRTWDSLNDAQRQNIAVSIAGTRHLNDFYTMMQQYDRAVDISVSSLMSSGSAMRNNQVVMQSFNKKIEQLKASWQSLWVDLGNAGLLDFLKQATNMLSTMVKLVDKLGTSFGGIGAGMTSMYGITSGVAAAGYIGTSVLPVAIQQGRRRTFSKSGVSSVGSPTFTTQPNRPGSWLEGRRGALGALTGIAAARTVYDQFGMRSQGAPSGRDIAFDTATNVATTAGLMKLVAGKSSVTRTLFRKPGSTMQRLAPGGRGSRGKQVGLALLAMLALEQGWEGIQSLTKRNGGTTDQEEQVRNLFNQQERFSQAETDIRDMGRYAHGSQGASAPDLARVMQSQRTLSGLLPNMGIQDMGVQEFLNNLDKIKEELKKQGRQIGTDIANSIGDVLKARLNTDQFKALIDKRDKLTDEIAKATDPADRAGKMAERDQVAQDIFDQSVGVLRSQALKRGRENMSFDSIATMVPDVAKVNQRKNPDDIMADALQYYMSGRSGYSSDIMKQLKDAGKSASSVQYFQFEKGGKVYDRSGKESNPNGNFVLKATDDFGEAAFINSLKTINKLSGDYARSLEKLVQKNDDLMEVTAATADALAKLRGVSGDSASGGILEGNSLSMTNAATMMLLNNGARGFKMPEAAAPGKYQNQIEQMLGQFNIAARNGVGIHPVGIAEAQGIGQQAVGNLQRDLGGVVKRILESGGKVFADPQSNVVDEEVGKEFTGSIRTLGELIGPDGAMRIAGMGNDYSKAQTQQEKDDIAQRMTAYANAGLSTGNNMLVGSKGKLLDKWFEDATGNVASNVNYLGQRFSLTQSRYGTADNMLASPEAQDFVTTLKAEASAMAQTIDVLKANMAKAPPEEQKTQLQPQVDRYQKLLDEVNATIADLPSKVTAVMVGREATQRDINNRLTTAASGQYYGYSGDNANRYQLTYLQNQEKQLGLMLATMDRNSTAALQTETTLKAVHQQTVDITGELEKSNVINQQISNGLKQSVLASGIERLMGISDGKDPTEDFRRMFTNNMRGVAENMAAALAPAMKGSPDAMRDALGKLEGPLAEMRGIVANLNLDSDPTYRKQYLLASPGQRSAADHIRELMTQGSTAEEIFADPYTRAAAQGNPLIGTLMDQAVSMDPQNRALELQERAVGFQADLSRNVSAILNSIINPERKAAGLPTVSVQDLLGKNPVIPPPQYKTGTIAKRGSANIDARGRIKNDWTPAYLDKGEIVLNSDQSENYLRMSNRFAKGTSPRGLGDIDSLLPGKRKLVDSFIKLAQEASKSAYGTSSPQQFSISPSAFPRRLGHIKNNLIRAAVAAGIDKSSITSLLDNLKISHNSDIGGMGLSRQIFPRAGSGIGPVNPFNKEWRFKLDKFWRRPEETFTDRSNTGRYGKLKLPAGQQNEIMAKGFYAGGVDPRSQRAGLTKLIGHELTHQVEGWWSPKLLSVMGGVPADIAKLQAMVSRQMVNSTVMGLHMGDVNAKAFRASAVLRNADLTGALLDPKKGFVGTARRNMLFKAAMEARAQAAETGNLPGMFKEGVDWHNAQREFLRAGDTEGFLAYHKKFLEARHAELNASGVPSDRLIAKDMKEFVRGPRPERTNWFDKVSALSEGKALPRTFGAVEAISKAKPSVLAETLGKGGKLTSRLGSTAVTASLLAPFIAARLGGEDTGVGRTLNHLVSPSLQAGLNAGMMVDILKTGKVSGALTPWGLTDKVGGLASKMPGVGKLGLGLKGASNMKGTIFAGGAKNLLVKGAAHVAAPFLATDIFDLGGNAGIWTLNATGLMSDRSAERGYSYVDNTSSRSRKMLTFGLSDQIGLGFSDLLAGGRDHQAHRDYEDTQRGADIMKKSGGGDSWGFMGASGEKDVMISIARQARLTKRNMRDQISNELLISPGLAFVGDNWGGAKSEISETDATQTDNAKKLYQQDISEIASAKSLLAKYMMMYGSDPTLMPPDAMATIQRLKGVIDRKGYEAQYVAQTFAKGGRYASRRVADFNMSMRNLGMVGDDARQGLYFENTGMNYQNLLDYENRLTPQQRLEMGEQGLMGQINAINSEFGLNISPQKAARAMRGLGPKATFMDILDALQIQVDDPLADNLRNNQSLRDKLNDVSTWSMNTDNMSVNSSDVVSKAQSEIDAAARERQRRIDVQKKSIEVSKAQSDVDSAYTRVNAALGTKYRTGISMDEVEAMSQNLDSAAQSLMDRNNTLQQRRDELRKLGGSSSTKQGWMTGMITDAQVGFKRTEIGYMRDAANNAMFAESGSASIKSRDSGRYKGNTGQIDTDYNKFHPYSSAILKRMVTTGFDNESQVAATITDPQLRTTVQAVAAQQRVLAANAGQNDPRKDAAASAAQMAINDLISGTSDRGVDIEGLAKMVVQGEDSIERRKTADAADALRTEKAKAAWDSMSKGDKANYEAQALMLRNRAAREERERNTIQGLRHTGGPTQPFGTYMMKDVEAYIPRKSEMYDVYRALNTIGREQTYTEPMRTAADSFMETQGVAAGSSSMDHSVDGEIRVSGTEDLVQQIVDKVYERLSPAMGGGGPKKGDRIKGRYEG